MVGRPQPPAAQLDRQRSLIFPRRALAMREGGSNWPDHARQVRQALTDPQHLCRELGLLRSYRPVRQAGGLLIRCPAHGDRTPSCSVTLGPDRTIRIRCFSCDLVGDALHLIATAAGLDLRRDFRRILDLGAQIGGIHLQDLSERPLTKRVEPPRPPDPPAERPYPPNEDVLELWERCLSVDQAPAVAAGLAGRGLEASLVARFDLGRALPPGGNLPRWARYQNQTWYQTGHHLLLPVYSAQGGLCSVRAWGFQEGSPKRLPPSGYRAGGLILANQLGQHLLRTASSPSSWPQEVPLRVVITEGEPDYLTWATRFPDADPIAPAVLGVVMGSWTEAMASRIPSGARVTIRTDHDDTGERYAALIYRTLTGRCTVLRPRATPL